MPSHNREGIFLDIIGLIALQMNKSNSELISYIDD